MIAKDSTTVLVAASSRDPFRTNTPDFPESWIQALTPHWRKEFEERGEMKILDELGKKPASLNEYHAKLVWLEQKRLERSKRERRLLSLLAILVMAILGLAIGVVMLN